jgi:hypothetical protein
MILDAELLSGWNLVFPLYPCKQQMYTLLDVWLSFVNLWRVSVNAFSWQFMEQVVSSLPNVSSYLDHRLFVFSDPCNRTWYTIQKPSPAGFIQGICEFF